MKVNDKVDWSKVDLKAYGLEHLTTKDLDIMYREYVRMLNVPIDALNGHTLEDIFKSGSNKVINMTMKEKTHE